ncbi:MAG: pyridoxal phosphate-dependent aminotransferase family protein [Flavobacteriaceae bacterium]|nr:pyridoxal phosphate-dependent aminotransferase family protein [Flavobacteriaceae bacterium]
MNDFPKKLSEKLTKRKDNDAFRSLKNFKGEHDFASNDYLGFSYSSEIAETAKKLLNEYKLEQNNATGSRLLTGNHELYPVAESRISNIHNAEAALIYNSGYMANVGFFGCVPQKDDLVFYDELCHASIREGIRLSPAKAYKFGHNDFKDLKEKLIRLTAGGDSQSREVYVVTETVFSMDGDSPDLKKLMELQNEFSFRLVLDEAHALGVMGSEGYGFVQDLKLENKCFARIYTFGKALGCKGAVVVGSKRLKEYLVNFSRSLIYTTALSPYDVALIVAAYEELQEAKSVREELNRNIAIFNQEILKAEFGASFIKSDSAIQSCIIPGNSNIKSLATELQNQGFDVRPILAPTVPKGKERLRFCLHSYNSEESIRQVVQLLAKFVK